MRAKISLSNPSSKPVLMEHRFNRFFCHLLHLASACLLCYPCNQDELQNDFPVFLTAARKLGGDLRLKEGVMNLKLENSERAIGERFWNIREAASYLGLSVAFLRKAVREKSVPFGRAGAKAIRFRKCDLDAWVCANGCAARGASQN